MSEADEIRKRAADQIEAAQDAPGVMRAFAELVIRAIAADASAKGKQNETRSET